MTQQSYNKKKIPEFTSYRHVLVALLLYTVGLIVLGYGGGTNNLYAMLLGFLVAMLSAKMIFITVSAIAHPNTTGKMTLNEITKKMREHIEDRDYDMEEVARLFAVQEVEPPLIPEDVATMIVKEAAKRLQSTPDEERNK